MLICRDERRPVEAVDAAAVTTAALSSSEKELGNTGAAQLTSYSRNKGRLRTRKIKQVLFQGAPTLPFAVLTNRGTRENAIYKVDSPLPASSW
ncbi:hypothetical protein PFLUV_G00019010 [Perca fluviatilis]|uniref:Uncharacterized protein n=1 Tax=Perca fluviatilis TaxID=8168 RepID=A0A6A5FNF0_PERFL|nr:hypothetical protein PFLUV_G00019010 [Perca fluviatilis]